MDSETQESEEANYTVVARRYRPRAFSELIGQDHVSQALGKAIDTGRVGHAYLFTGARGVGKTSTARIFAKALNVPADVSAEQNDIADAIDAGEDMDVIEIDGASNRGIDEIRQLRANVNVRPSRARYKIYIIDEVHMLTNQAFNALLKTLEEPPPHVKFIFCTTDPDKIPITVLSRCQRYDFAPVKFEAIQRRLEEICTAEGYQADSEALALLARRAAGSMRDSQSLLEQVMSFSVERITVEQVHELLGTADEGRLRAIAQALQDADALEVLKLIDVALNSGADPGQLAEQLLNYLRDLLAVGVGGSADLLKLANPAGFDQLQQLAQQWGVQAILSAIQIMDESLVRMRASVSAATLLEVAVVQICQLDQLMSIPALLESLGTAPQAARTPGKATVEKKNGPPEPQAVVAAAASQVAAGGNDQQPPPTARRTPGPDLDSTAVQSVQAPATEQIASGSVAHTEDKQPAAAKPSGESSERGGSTAGGPEAGELSASQPARSSETPPPTAVAGGQSGAADASSDCTDLAGMPTSAQNASPHALQIWKNCVGSIDGMLADFAQMAVAVEPNGSDVWKVIFPQGGQKTLEYCQQSERKQRLQDAVATGLGRSVQLNFAVLPGEPPRREAAPPQSTVRVQRLREASEHPYVKQLCEAIGGEIIRVDPPRTAPPSAGPPSAASTPND